MTASRKPPSLTRKITVISDTICPWCFVGKYRMEAALALLAAEGLAFAVEWHPYQLNPDMPEGGMERRAYRAAKFGSSAKSDAMDRQLTEIGASLGIGFRYDLIRRTPNTLASHLLVAEALQAGGSALQNQVVESLFQAYFTQGRDVGRAEVLREIAREAGFDHDPAALPDLRARVAAEDLAARRVGIRGVPSVICADMPLFSGAQPPEVIAETLRQVAALPEAGL